MILKGFASKNSTKILAKSNTGFAYNTLGKTDLLVSEVGFGSYRIDVKSSLNREALKKAVLSGINLIDTSSTYTDGNSELLVGAVLKKLVTDDKVSRESIVIVTKGGYLQGQNFTLSQLRKKDNKPFEDLVEYQKGLEHCIHPEFLEDQIQRSLKRLGVETIDIYLLHNPEYYLKWAKNNNIDIEIARKEYYSRIKKSFEHLEKEVQKGRIKHYGISSNTFPSSMDDFDFTSLEAVIKIAKEISANNHFSVIEFPMNLAEANAFTKVNQSNNMTLLQLAQSNNIGVLINRPLNAIFDNKLITLAEPTVQYYSNPEIIKNEFEKILTQEQLIYKELKHYRDKEFLSKIGNNLFIYEELNNDWSDFKTLASWQAALNQYFSPRLQYCKNLIANKMLGNKKLETELFYLADKINHLFDLIASYYSSEHLKLTHQIKNDIKKSKPELASAKNISNMSIRALRSTKGINTVLVGMVQPSYVIDVVEELKTPVNKDFKWDDFYFRPMSE